MPGVAYPPPRSPKPASMAVPGGDGLGVVWLGGGGRPDPRLLVPDACRPSAEANFKRNMKPWPVWRCCRRELDSAGPQVPALSVVSTPRSLTASHDPCMCKVSGTWLVQEMGAHHSEPLATTGEFWQCLCRARDWKMRSSIACYLASLAVTAASLFKFGKQRVSRWSGLFLLGDVGRRGLEAPAACASL